MLLPTYINVNRGGIPAISSLSVNVTTTEVQFDFNNHRNIGAPFRGLLIVRLNQAIPTGTTTTLPVVFTSSGGNPQRLTGFNGADITVAQISGTGIYLCWHTTNTLQLLTGIAFQNLRNSYLSCIKILSLLWKLVRLLTYQFLSMETQECIIRK